jgi:hypothetical protein
MGIPLRIPASKHSYNTAFRGGAGDAAKPEEGEEQDEEEEQEQEKEQPRKLWPVDNLFRLNDDVKSEAASVTNAALPLEENLENDPSLELPLKTTSKTKSNNTNSRGGALTMVKAPKPRRFAWLAPLDTSRVAPSSSRLLQDEEDQVEQANAATAAATASANSNSIATASENATATDTKTASVEMTSFNQIWWGNVWDQQLPDDDEQVNMENSNDLISDKVLEEPEPIPVQEPERTRPSPVQEPERKRPSKKAKRKASREASAADAKLKQNAEAIPIVEKDMIQRYNDDGSLVDETIRMEQEIEADVQLSPALTLTAQPIHTTDTTRSPTDEESPSLFISSGYVSDEHREFVALFPFVVACIHTSYPFFFCIHAYSGSRLIES